MSEIEAAVRVLAKHLGKFSDKSFHLIVDADGTFAYEWVSREILASSELAHLELDLLLDRRARVRAETFGTDKS